MCQFLDLFLNRDWENLLNWDICDLDAERTEKDRLKLVFEPGQNVEPFSSDLFILLEGNYFSEIINQARNIEKICEISGIDFGLKNISALFRSDKMIVAIIGDTDPRHSAEIVNLLSPYVEMAKNVVTLTTKPMVDFRQNTGDNQLEVKGDKAFIRGINSKLSHIKEMQAPNMICGVAAGVASWRTFKALPVESYVIFVRQIHIDEDSTQKVLQLLQELGSGNVFDYKPKRRQPSSLFL